jgi:enamine deaminase RidA (YjgF/YER057c/UK114 family)
MVNQSVLPEGWPRPKGYSQGVVARGRTVYVAGQIGWNSSEEFGSDDFAEQAGLAFRNIIAILDAAGGKPEHVTRLTWYVVDKQEYLASLAGVGAAYRAAFGQHYPVMSVVEVTALMEDRARIEVEATAVIPD